MTKADQIVPTFVKNTQILKSTHILAARWERKRKGITYHTASTLAYLLYLLIGGIYTLCFALRKGFGRRNGQKEGENRKKG